MNLKENKNEKNNINDNYYTTLYEPLIIMILSSCNTKYSYSLSYHLIPVFHLGLDCQLFKLAYGQPGIQSYQHTTQNITIGTSEQACLENSFNFPRAFLGFRGTSQNCEVLRSAELRWFCYGVPSESQSLFPQEFVDLFKQHWCQLMPLQQPPKVEDCRLIRNRFFPQLDTGKPAHRFYVIKRVFHHWIGKVVPVL